MSALRRRIARLRTVLLLLFVLSVALGLTVSPLPLVADLAVSFSLCALAFVGPPRADREPVDVDAPVRGRWVAVNSPGTRVPSHGVRSYGQAYAVDVLHPTARGASTRLGWGLRPRPAGAYPTYGEPVRAVADGVVVAVADTQRDHRGRDTWPALVWMLVVEAFFRELGGQRWILGNHVVVDHGDGVWSACAHLRRGSVTVQPGTRVRAGQVLAQVGNSGNTSEPHLHFQLMDAPAATGAAGLPWRWRGVDPLDETDPARTTGDPKPSAIDGVPPNGQVFLAGAVRE
ncbi:M23 family metallopeptidase [Nocardioides sp. SR21]|uniref:M23 family metallopeptidase n=1 Tax=Nocardioides sp. SR21 TaxID=2919501 RepID=UPI001FA9B404|nr:M23 family metallopeptidase [Nocardioides sp. SR21]